MKRGLFITFEGPDKAGKSTQIRLFCEYLEREGTPYVLTREPGGCEVSEKIRNIILDIQNDMGPICEAMLYAAARAELVRQVIRPAVEGGTLVVCDRYVDSSIAYQGFGRELGYEYVKQLNEAAVDGMIPDLTYYLRMDPDEAMGRMKGEQKDRLESAGRDFRSRVMQGYEQLAKENPNRIAAIRANQSIPEVHRQVIAAFEQIRGGRA